MSPTLSINPNNSKISITSNFFYLRVNNKKGGEIFFLFSSPQPLASPFLSTPFFPFSPLFFEKKILLLSHIIRKAVAPFKKTSHCFVYTIPFFSSIFKAKKKKTYEFHHRHNELPNQNPYFLLRKLIVEERRQQLVAVVVAVVFVVAFVCQHIHYDVVGQLQKKRITI